ncbi:MAG: hypothetical protein C0459_04010 [Chitinophaga sp.]|jgi:cytosine/adenosine deaminase-related metal-dependent hydrolase|nr:hypothetical protein [Chitinophaga sp.]
MLSLNNFYTIDTPEKAAFIQIKNGKITLDTFDELKPIDCKGSFLLPGFINFHDHLDFNLFPQLGKEHYQNYTEWGPFIQAEFKNEIKEVLSITQQLRTQWGIYKNLLNGFTTVVNHGEKLINENELINVIQHFTNLHSPAFEKNWQWKLKNPFNLRVPVSMHIGEGIDELANKEIEDVIHHNWLQKKIIAIHTLQINQQQSKRFTGIVTCPASNHFMFNQTINSHQVEEGKLLFGSDSTLTADWNIWNHFKLAVNQYSFSNNTLLQSLTTNAASILKLNSNATIEDGSDADLLLIQPKQKKEFCLADYSCEDIFMLLSKGNILLFDETLKNDISIEGFTLVKVNSVLKYVKGNLLKLMNDIKKYNSNIHFPIQAISYHD